MSNRATSARRKKCPTRRVLERAVKRYQMEELENRLLLSGSAVSPVAEEVVNSEAASAKPIPAPATPSADVVFSDSEFDDANWSVSPYNVGNGGSVSAETLGTGGHPGAYRWTSILLNAAPSPTTYSIAAGNYSYTAQFYDPHKQGAIVSIDYSQDSIRFSTIEQIYRPIVVQNGQIYVTTTFNNLLASSWRVQGLNGLTDASFVAIDSSAHPNFSANGSPINFGYQVQNSTAVGGTKSYQTSGGIDNWKMVIHRLPPKLAITTDQPTYYIGLNGGTGAMPQVHAHVSLDGVDIDPATLLTTDFNWSVHLSAPIGFADHQIRDYTMSPDLEQTIHGFDDYTPQFTTIAGGYLTLKVTATIDGLPLEATTSAKILGQDPGPAAIIARLNSEPTPANWPMGTYDYHDVLRRIAKQESKSQQFIGGYPQFNGNGDGGVGIMQITIPAPSILDVWDWKINIDDGVVVFNEKLQGALAYPGRLIDPRAKGNIQPYLDDRKVELHLSSITLSPFFNPDRYVREAVQRYNSGNAYYPTLDFDLLPHVIVQPDNTGIVPWSQAGNGYVNIVLGPEIWPAPIPAHSDPVTAPFIDIPLPSGTVGIVNGGFQTGDLTGWQAIGTASVSTARFASGTKSIANEALIQNHDNLLASGTPVMALESFLGVTAGTLSGLSSDPVVQGSAIKQSFTAVAGEVLSFNYDFLTNESELPANDFLFVSLGPSSASVLADAFTATSIQSPVASFASTTNYMPFRFTIPVSGNYTLAIGVVDVLDQYVNSAALISNVKVLLPGDANGDGNVDFPDLVAVAQNYGASGKTWADGDFNGDGSINFADLVAVAQNYGVSVSMPAPVPAAIPDSMVFTSAPTPASAASTLALAAKPPLIAVVRPTAVEKPLTPRLTPATSTARLSAVPLTKPTSFNTRKRINDAVWNA